MRNLIIFSLALLLITSSTELHQFMKIPFLLQHFHDHKNEDPSLSLLAFLKIHYTDNHHPDDNDDREDNELPFKSAGNIFHLDTPTVAKREAVHFIIYPEKRIYPYNDEGNLCHRSFSIFHPPCIA